MCTYQQREREGELVERVASAERELRPALGEHVQLQQRGVRQAQV